MLPKKKKKERKKVLLPAGVSKSAAHTVMFWSIIFKFYFQEFGERPGRKWLDHLLLGEPQMESVEKTEQASSANSANSATEWMISSDVIQVKDHSFVDSFRRFHSERESAFTCWMTR